MKESFLNLFFKDERGQSLMEIIISLSIGAILIGTASFGIAFILRSGTTNQNLNNASQFTQGLLSNVQSFGNSDWQNIYSLNKGLSNQYFLIASGTSFAAQAGQEGVIDNDITNGLVGAWKFDEDITTTSTTTYDSSGNLLNATIVNSPTRITSGCKVSNCLSFSGVSDYALINDANVLDVSSTFSLTSWIYTSTSSVLQTIISKDGVGTDTTGAYNLYVGTDLSIKYETNNDVDTVNSISNAITLNKWHYVIVTFDNSTSTKVHIYVNGADVGSGNAMAPSVLNTNLLLGRRGLGSYFKGYLDDIRIYNRVLSPSEITRFYNSQIFSRYFYVENVCRTNDSSANISTTTSSCPGGTLDDPLTQKITAVTQWLLGAGTDQVNLARYLTRWSNFAVRQTDWSGGTGQEGPVTAPNNLYSSSTNVAVTSTLGSFQIQNLSQQ